MPARLVGDLQQQASVTYGETQLIRPLMPGGEGAYRLEDIFLDQVEDRDAPFLLDVGVAPQDGRLVEFDMRDARVRHDATALYALAARTSKPACAHPQAVD